MQKLEVYGANKLKGKIKISGSKNASLPILAATLLSNKKIRLKNLPKVKDIETMKIMNGDLDAYSDVIRKLSSELNTDLLDLREIFMNYISKNNPNNEPFGITTYDGVHLNDLGNKLIADEMIKFID